MKLLGNPQEKLKVVHVAGTSGKGSTVYLMSNILQSQGFQVGLSVSPHMFDIRERMQVFRSPVLARSRTHTTNAGHPNTLPSKKLVLEYFNQILPAIQKMKKSKYGMPTFFEINVALAYYMFAKEKLDYAVMETGLGGRLDATNCVRRNDKISIITKIGHDHDELLGNTLAEICKEKCGIINNQNSTISIQQLAANTIKKKCEEKNSDLFLLDNKNCKIISATSRKTVFDFQFTPVIPSLFCLAEALAKCRTRNPEILKQVQHDNIPDSRFCGNDSEGINFKNVQLGLIGLHQAENCSLALACLCLLSKRDGFEIDEKKLRKSLENMDIPGRFNIIKYGNREVIVDGAHNPQKMEIFTRNLSKIYPGQKFDFVIAFKKSKDFKKMLEILIPLANKISLSSFSISGNKAHSDSTDNRIISEYLKNKGFNNFEIIKNNEAEILKTIKSSKKPVIITGSLYFIGSVYPCLIKK